MHRAALLLPEFGRAKKEVEVSGERKRRASLLGSGFVARLCAEYVVRNTGNEFTIGRSVVPLN